MSDAPRRDGGACTLYPNVARVGSTQSYFLNYTVGPKGLSAGSGLSILPPWGGGKTQLEDPNASGYVTAQTDGDAALQLQRRCVRTWWYRTTQGDRNIEIWCEILVEVEAGRLVGGDTVDIVFHDLEAQFVTQHGKAWGVRAYHGKWTPRSTPIPQHGPSVSYVPAPPDRLGVCVPSVVKPGDSFALKASVLDGWYNPAEGSQRFSLRFSSEPPGIQMPENGSPAESSPAFDGNHVTVAGLSIPRPDVYRIVVEAEVRDPERPGLHILGKSNPVSREAKAADRLYWGDIHIHTELSDGVGTPEKAYQLARDVYHLDFCALSDHDLRGERWERARSASATYNRSGRFVTFPAYEWTSEAFGHRNAYFRSEGRTVPCPPSSPDFTVRQLFDALRSDAIDCLVIPHHPLWHMDFSHHDPDLERLVEIYSIWGSSEHRGNPLQFLSEKQPGYIHNESVREALARGYKLGFVASGDSHLQYPGDPFPAEKIRPPVTPETEKEGIIFGPGKIAVFAPSLERQSIWNGMKARRCYATTGARIILRFSVNGCQMGGEIAADGSPKLTVWAAGTDSIRSVELIKDGEVVRTFSCSADVESLSWVDERLTASCYYYAKVVQSNGETAWSTPIWVRRGR